MKKYSVKTPPSKQQGFTLVEVVLALSLTTLLLALLSTGVYVVADDWNRNSDVLDASLDEAMAVLQIDRALQGAFPHSYTDEETLSRLIYFQGSDDYISWVSAVSPQRDAGLTVWELFPVQDEGVFLKLVPAYSDNPQERMEQAEPRLMLPGYDVAFSYLYQELDESKVWRDDWDGVEFLSLPLAIYAVFTPFDLSADDDETLEILVPIRNNQHRSIRPNIGLFGGALN